MLDRQEQRMTKVASFEIHYTQYLDASGEVVAELPEFAADPAALIPLYRAMVLTRRFDAKAIALQRTGRLGTYASSLGQEAVTVGLAAAMLPEDVLLPTYREAGAWQVPAVFVINNNQWAISMPRSAQTAAGTLAQKAIAAGIPGMQVDGNDVIAVREAVAQALARARSGEGSSVVEALTYRMTDHTTADDAGRYGEIDAAVERYLATPPMPPEAMFDHLYAVLPAAYTEQQIAASRGGDHA